MVHPSIRSTSHPTHAQPGAETTPSPSLHHALASLMVNLDDELLRYRHSRTGQGPRPEPQRKLTFRAKARPSPSLIHFNSSGAKPPQGQTVRGTSVETVPSGRAPNASPPGTSAAAETGVRAWVPAQSSVAMGSTLVPYAAMPDAYLESTAALLGSAPPTSDPTVYPDTYYSETDYDEADYQPSLAQRLSTPLGVGALLLLLVGSAGFGYLVTSPTAIDHLRNHAWVQRFQSAPTPESAAHSTASPATVAPVPTGLQGIGPDLSGQEFGSLDLDRVSRLPADPSRPNPTVDPTLVPPANPLVNPAADPTADSASSAPSPTAAQRFREEDPSSARPRSAEALRPSGTRTEPVVPLSRPRPTTVAPSAVTPVPASPRPTAPPPASRPATSQVPAPRPAAPAVPNAQPPQPLGTVTTAPTPDPVAVTPPPPLAPSSSAPAARSNYYVVTDYTGNQSLESARGVVSDAYVRNFQGSTKIQMGAFSQESSARDLMQQLQQQGIPAQVYNRP